MKWNWEVFLKSWLFGFLGFLIGIVSTVIYLAVDVDLKYWISLLGGSSGWIIALIAIWKYHYKKNMRKISDIVRRLDMVYRPTEKAITKFFMELNNEGENPSNLVRTFQDLEDELIEIGEYKDLINDQEIHNKEKDMYDAWRRFQSNGNKNNYDALIVSMQLFRHQINIAINNDKEEIEKQL